MATIKAKRKTFNPKTPTTCTREVNSSQKAVRIAEKKIKAARRLGKNHMAAKKSAAKKLTAKKKVLQKAKSRILKDKNLTAEKAAAKKKLTTKKQTSTKRKVAKKPTTTKRKVTKKRTSTKKPVSTGKRTTAKRRKVAKRAVQGSQRGQEYQACEAFSEQRAGREEDLGQLAVAISGPAPAQEQSRPGGFASDQIQGIEQIVRGYLLAHPEVLILCLAEYQQRKKLADKEHQQQAVIASRAALTQDPDSPVAGNPDGDVSIVEFFDYKCPYCRRVASTIKDVVAADGKIRLVMKEFPVLGPQSIKAARAALAAVKQGKYEKFHWALMTEPGDMSDPHIRQIARTVGLDVEQMQKDMESPEIQAMAQRNRELARALQITGTPAFVIDDTLVPGAIDRKTLEHLVAQARAKQS